MRFWFVFRCAVGAILLAGGKSGAAESAVTNMLAVTSPVYVPDTSHQNEPLPDGIFAWDGLMKETNVAANNASALFVFNFTNITADKVAILSVHAGCACTTVQLPPLPWIIPSGSNAQVGFKVNLAGRTGSLIKTATVTTDKGFKALMFKINILPPVQPTQSDADRVRALEMAKADRQMIFRGDCATCHAKPGEAKYGQPLYDAVCGICHDSKRRASMVPDLRTIKSATNADFWKTWIANGKAGTLMPAFSTANGGSLSDTQIASLVIYLVTAYPSQLPANK